MEKIKVNMTPCEGVQTIHASQNDNEGREWGFALHNNGDAIDSSEITDQMVFKAYEGGTEQILPENTSTPTTSPFLGDIKYPQDLLTDQEFTYRQSQTEEDGLAKIQTIYGNTLKWNQLNDNSDGSRSRNGVAFTKNNDGSWTISGTTTSNNTFMNINNSTLPLTYIQDHIYLFTGASSNCNIRLYANGVTKETFNSDAIFKADSTLSEIYTRWQIYPNTADVTVNETLFHMYIDLTEMFGQTKAEEILAMGQTDGIAYFRSLYPLPFYSYDGGSLLPFRGEGIKTVGFNQFNKETVTDGKRVNNTGALVDRLGQSVSDYIKVISGQRYYLNHVLGGTAYYTVALYDANKNFVSVLSVSGSDDASGIITIPQNTHYIRVNMRTDLKDSVCVNISNTEQNGTYEPYTSSTLSLPISTYFPNGMKSAGTVYDELTETKAITRVGSVDLGMLTWTKEQNHFYSDVISNSIKPSAGVVPNIICSKYLTYAYAIVISETKDGAIGLSSTPRIYVYDSTYTDATTFKQAMTDQNVKLYYELATSTETSFSTASLVTENAEIPLSNNDGVLIGKCTEQLSENPGFIDAKIKLSDSDGTCYSNKIQLHIERSPQ